MYPILYEISLFGKLIPLYSYGFMLGMSMILGWYLILWLSKKEKLNEVIVGRAIIIIVICSLLGARLLHLITNYSDYQGRFLAALFSTKQQGLVFYGGFILAALVSMSYLKLKRINIWAFADCAAPALGFGLFLTRIGCFLFGCCFGAKSEILTSVTFPAGSPAFNLHVRQGLIEKATDHSLHVHASQLYSSFNGLILGVIVLYLYLYKKKFHGQIFWTFVLLYAPGRFFLETIREDPGRGVLFSITTSQWISLVGFLFALWMLRSLKNKKTSPKRKPSVKKNLTKTKSKKTLKSKNNLQNADKSSKNAKSKQSNIKQSKKTASKSAKKSNKTVSKQKK